MWRWRVAVRVSSLYKQKISEQNLAAHAAIARAPGVSARVVPTLRPDALFKVGAPGFLGLLQQLNAVSGVEVSDYDSFLVALRQRRRAFVDAGALATDHGVNDLGATPIAPLSTLAARMTFAQALEGTVAPEGAAAFEGHMLFEMARMSAQDGLVMQLHCGVYRDHDAALRDTFGPDSGGDVPRAQEFVRALRPLLAEFGSHPNMTIIVFTLDEDAYARELAPLAGAYPALKLGPPWWFHDSRNGMRRYLDRVTESAGVYSLAGFNDDTRAFPSIPARHALWRRAVSGWAAGMVDDGAMDMEEAKEVVYELAYGLAKKVRVARSRASRASLGARADARTREIESADADAFAPRFFTCLATRARACVHTSAHTRGHPPTPTLSHANAHGHTNAHTRTTANRPTACKRRPQCEHPWWS